jgi:AraC-like DNA-binding protein
MPTRDTFTDLALLEYPPLSADDGNPDAAMDAADADLDLDQLRAEHIRQMEMAWEEGDVDPVLSRLRAVRRQQLAAERHMRLLLAYAREFIGPRPYSLAALAEAAGMSISGVRTAYDEDEITAVEQITGSRPRQRSGKA